MWTNTEPRFESVGLLHVLLCSTCIYRCQSRDVEKMTGWVTCYWHALPQILQYHIDREACHYWSGRLRSVAVSNSNSAHVTFNLFYTSRTTQAVALVHLMRYQVSTQIICVLVCMKLAHPSPCPFPRPFNAPLFSCCLSLQRAPRKSATFTTLISDLPSN